MSVSSAPPIAMSPIAVSPVAGPPAHAVHAADEAGAGGRGAGDHGTARRHGGPAVRIAPSVLRMSLGGRLVLAGGCLALLWTVVLLVVESGA